MFIHLLLLSFFLSVTGVVGHYVIIRNGTESKVYVNETNYLLCETNIPEPTYQWFYFLGNNEYQALISNQYEPRYEFSYSGEGRGKIVCRVNYGGGYVESEPIDIHVVEARKIHVQPPSSVEIGRKVTILNDSRTIVEPNTKNYLVCKATFPVKLYEWVYDFEKHGQILVNVTVEPKFYFQHEHPGAGFSYRCRAPYNNTMYDSQTVWVIVAGQIQIQSNYFLIAIFLLITACINLEKPLNLFS